MGLDFFGVTMAADIQVFGDSARDGDLGVSGIPFKGADGEGLTYDLWLESNSDSRVPAALRNLSYVQDITVEVGMGLNSKVQLVLAPPFEEGLVLLNSPLIQWGVGRLNVTFGYSTGDGAGRESYSFGGILQKPDVKIGNDITITLNSLGVGYAMKLSGGTAAESYAVDDTPASVVKRVLSKYKAVNIDHIYDDFKDGQQSATTGIPFFKPIFKDTPFGVEQKVLERGPRNDWWFISSIVRSYGLELLVIDREFRVKASDDWRKGEVKEITKRFRLRAGVDPTPTEGKPIYPVLSLSSPTTAVWLGSGIGRQVMKDIKEDKANKVAVRAAEKIDAEAKAKLEEEEGKPDSAPRKRKTKAEREAEASAKEAIEILDAEIGRAAKDNAAWGTTKDNRFRAGPMSAGTNFPGNPNSSMKDAATGAIKRMNHLKGIHVDVQTIGLPDMLPGDLVKIDGFAVEGSTEGVFDGIYGVIEVRHQIGLGGFMTTYKAISNFIPRQFPISHAAAGGIPKDTEDKTPGSSQSDRVTVVSRDEFQSYENAIDELGDPLGGQG
jgi:hypothetical protein